MTVDGEGFRRQCLRLFRNTNYVHIRGSQGFPSSTHDIEPASQSRRHERCSFDPWVWKIPWRRAWQATPVLLPGEPHGQRSLEGYSPRDHKKSDTTGVTEHTGVRGALIAICIDLWRRDDTFSLHCNTLFYVLKQTGSCKTVFPSKKLVGTLSALGSYSTGGAINPRLSCAVGAKCLFTISDCRLHMHSVVSC